MKIKALLLALLPSLAILASCNNTAETEPIPVTDIVLSPTSLALAPGQTSTLTVTYIPADATTGKQCVFSSDKPNIVTVDPNGVVTAIAAGTANIWAVSGSILKICPVTVEKDPKITSLKVIPESLEICVGGYSQVILQKVPADATEAIVCTSDNPSVATGLSSGLIQAIAVGTTTVHFKTANCDAQLNVKVIKDNITSLTVTPSSANVTVGGTYQLSTVTVPSGATGFSWSSDDESIATVDATGKVTGVKLGTTTVKAKSERCESSATITVISDDITSLSVAPKTSYVYEGATVQLAVTTVPEKSSETLSWSTDNASIATVDQNGLVTGVAQGSTTVRVSSKYCSADATINVQDGSITAITVSPSSAVVTRSKTTQINIQVFPSGATEKVSWSSDNTAVATVDQNGLVTGVGLGSTTIRVSSKNAAASVAIDVCNGISLMRIDALRRIENKTVYKDETEPIRVARGETAVVQMKAEAIESFNNPTVELTYFGTSSGQKLVTPRLYWQREVTSSRHWAEWAGGAPPDEYFALNDKYFDPLMPQDYWKPSTVAKGGYAALWCELDIPGTFTPGTYEGEIKVAAGSYSGTKKFTVEVYDVTLPETQTLNVINWETGGFKEMHGGTPDDMYSVRDKYMPTIIKFMNDYCQNAWRLLPYSNWDEPQVGKLWGEVGTDGKIVYIFGNMEKEIKMIDANARNLKQIHGLQFVHLRDGDYGVKLPAVGTDGKSIVKKEYRSTASDFNAVMGEFARQLKEFLSGITLNDGRTAWSVYVQTICDEPTDEYAAAYTRVARALKSGAPDIKITDAIMTSQIASDAIDYPCPTLNLVETYRATGNQTQWFYTAMGPQGNYANRFVRVPLIKTRLVHWCSYYYGAAGYLHWGLKYWEGCDDPYGDVAGQIMETGEPLPGGDCHIVYPGDKVVYPSIRLCAMRDGIRDYELLKMVEARSTAQAQTYLNSIVRGAADYNTDVDNFRATRKQMLEYLAQ